MRGKRDPEALTAREREALSLIRLGLTNEEIAERLGITLDGAKYHVSQILSKLGVATREEAAAWTPERRRWWAAWPLAAKAAGAAVAIAALVGLGVLVWGVFETGEQSSTASETRQSDSGSIAWVPGQVIHKVFELRGAGLSDGKTSNMQEYWILVGIGDNTQKARVFLRDETGYLLQEGFSDAESATTVNRQSGVDTTIERPTLQSVFMWNATNVQEKLLSEGFTFARQGFVAGLAAKVYEKKLSATGCPGLASATQIVKDVYISSEPFGLDLGEQAVCWSESGESTLLSGRVLQTIEVRDVSAAPEGVFDWTTPAPSSTPQLAPLLPYPLSPES